MKSTGKEVRFALAAILVLILSMSVCGQKMPKMKYHPPPIHPTHPVEPMHLPIKPKLSEQAPVSNPLILQKKPISGNSTSPLLKKKKVVVHKTHHAHLHKVHQPQSVKTCKEEPNQSKCLKK